jgi:endonuclease-3
MLLFEGKRLEEIHQWLLRFYGKPPERDVWDPLKQFIYSLLSSRTKTEFIYEVVEHLESHFGSWEKLRDAPVVCSHGQISPG